MKPADPTTTFLIRHAESEANAGGATDSPVGIRLTERGHQQAVELAARFDHAPDLIVVSPYLRTRQTAGPLITRHPHVPVEEWPVHEFTYLNPTLYTGTTEAQRGVFAESYWQRCDVLWNDGGGAESFADFIQRIDDLSRRLLERPHSQIAVFTHGYFIKACRMRRERPDASVDAAFMAEFRDTRKDCPVANAEIIGMTRHQ